MALRNISKVPGSGYKLVFFGNGFLVANPREFLERGEFAIYKKKAFKIQHNKEEKKRVVTLQGDSTIR